MKRSAWIPGFQTGIRRGVDGWDGFLEKLIPWPVQAIVPISTQGGLYEFPEILDVVTGGVSVVGMRGGVAIMALPSRTSPR
jgi:hypothetical protein